MKPAFTALAAILFGLFANTGTAADLNLQISGADPARGQFLVSVFDNSETWMKRAVSDKIVKVAPNGSASTRFDLSPGTYGVAIVHDENGDGKIDVNAFGIPTEAFGFSNNARALFGPPKFKRARFKLGETGSYLTINLNTVN